MDFSSGVKMEYIIEAINVECTYNPSNYQEKSSDQVLGISIGKLKIPAVGVTSIVGPSGSGKSTLVGLLSGLRQADSSGKNSSLNFNKSGRSYSLLDPKNFQRGDFGFVFQEAHLLKNLPARLNAEMTAAAISENLNNSKIDRIADDLEIFDKLEMKTSSLSGGQAQRLACIRALVIDPNILICDEPTSSLDERTGRLLMQTIKKWAVREKKAVLWVTHNLDQAAEFSDYLLRVESGKILCGEDGAPIHLSGHSDLEKKNILAGFSPKQTAFKTPKTEPEVSLKQPEIYNGIEKKDEITPWVNKYFFVFCLRMALLEIYGNNRSSRSREPLTRLFSSKIFAPFRYSMTLAIGLGIVVLFSLFSIKGATESYFTAELNNPAVSHFMIKSQGGFPLSNKTIKNLQFKIATRASLETSERFIFGRREFGLQKVWLPNAAGCSAKTKKTAIAPMMVYNEDEPLFDNRFSEIVRSENNRSEPYIIGTQLLRSALGIDTSADNTLAVQETGKLSICVNIHGTGVKLSVLNYDGIIPGGSDRTFTTAIPEQFYRSAVMKIDRDKLRTQTFHSAAVYFTQPKYKNIACAFGALEDCDDDGPILPKSKSKINEDITGQIEKLVSASRVSSWVLTMLIGSFGIVISMSTILAVSAFVYSKEKTLALLKAYRAGVLNLFLILSTHVFVLFCNAALFASIICATLRWTIMPLLNDFTSNSKIDFGLGLSDIFLGILTIFLVLLICTSSVIYRWNMNQKYVGVTLQSV